MIDTLRLKSGRVPGAPGTTIRLEPITVFVGPNNSGKSKVLSEIEHYCRWGSQISTPRLILENLAFTSSSAKEADAVANQISRPPRPEEASYGDCVYVPFPDNNSGWTDVFREQLVRAIQDPRKHVEDYCRLVVDAKTLMLNGKNRIDLVDEQKAGDLLSLPQPSLQALFLNDDKRKEVRDILARVFDRHFVIDPTHLGYFRIRFAERRPNSVLEERGLHDEAIQYHAQALPIESFSDGVKAFTGMIMEVTAGDPQIILIDEPEAFLHPSLAEKLGSELSRAASTGKRVFVSTHSPAFVMGCVQSGVPLNIIRLTYQKGVATSRVLPSGEVSRLMRNPLLRSTGVLSGLFYESVVVTEGDSDRAFYQEINQRLLSYDPERGIPNCLFLNAQNKDTIHDIINPLRELGIPTVGILDIDVVVPDFQLRRLLKAAHVPEGLHTSLSTLRKTVCDSLKATGLDMKTKGGLSTLDSGERETANNLLNQLSDYGIFVVPDGELESWLKSLSAKSYSKNQWLIQMFKRMGEDPDAPDYVRPADDDVWQFMSKIKAWLTDPKRKGIPS